MLQAFFRREWGTSRDDGSWTAEVPQWVCVRGDEAIGYLGSIPARFRVDGSLVSGHWLKGFWVAEPYRSGPVGHLILERAVSDLEVVAAQVVAAPATRLMESQGLTQRCILFNRVLLLRSPAVFGRLDVEALRPGAIPAPLLGAIRLGQRAGIASLVGLILDGGTALLRALADQGAASLSVDVGWNVPSATLDALWEELSVQFGTAPERDARRLTERYAADSRYSLATVWEGSRLRGWAVVRAPSEKGDPRLSGLAVAATSDALYPLDRPGVGMAVLAAAESVARDAGADALICSGSHPDFERLLSARGYLPFPGSVRVMARDPSGRFATDARRTWITRGDARSDEAF